MLKNGLPGKKRGGEKKKHFREVHTRSLNDKGEKKKRKVSFNQWDGMNTVLEAGGNLGGLKGALPQKHAREGFMKRWFKRWIQCRVKNFGGSRASKILSNLTMRYAANRLRQGGKWVLLETLIGGIELTRLRIFNSWRSPNLGTWW